MRALVERCPTDSDVIRESLLDTERFGALYDRYADQLYRYAYRRVGPEYAEDAVAETFLAAFRRRAGYDLARTDARPWLFGILSRELAARHRAEDTRFRALARAGVADVTGGFADEVVTAVTAQGAGAAIAEALRRLPAGDRDVVLLIAWNGFSYEEVAETLGIKLRDGAVPAPPRAPQVACREAVDFDDLNQLIGDAVVDNEINRRTIADVRDLFGGQTCRIGYQAVEQDPADSAQIVVGRLREDVVQHGPDDVLRLVLQLSLESAG